MSDLVFRIKAGDSLNLLIIIIIYYLINGATHFGVQTASVVFHIALI